MCRRMINLNMQMLSELRTLSRTIRSLFPSLSTHGRRNLVRKRYCVLPHEHITLWQLSGMFSIGFSARTWIFEEVVQLLVESHAGRGRWGGDRKLWRRESSWWSKTGGIYWTLVVFFNLWDALLIIRLCFSSNSNTSLASGGYEVGLQSGIFVKCTIPYL